MKQVVILHGGNSFLSHRAYLADLRTTKIDYDRLKHHQRWREWIAEQMPDTDVLLPTMPNSSNAQFEEWKIYFEKLMPFLDDDVRLVGHSLGAMFLAKYLQNNPLKRKVRQLILISGAYKDDPDNNCGSFRVTSATNLPRSTEEIHLFHSKDDHVVPFSELQYFRQDLPEATVHVLKDRGHFLEPTFPELLEVLRKK